MIVKYDVIKSKYGLFVLAINEKYKKGQWGWDILELLHSHLL